MQAHVPALHQAHVPALHQAHVPVLHQADAPVMHQAHAPAMQAKIIRLLFDRSTSVTKCLLIVIRRTVVCGVVAAV